MTPLPPPQHTLTPTHIGEVHKVASKKCVKSHISMRHAVATNVTLTTIITRTHAHMHTRQHTHSLIKQALTSEERLPPHTNTHTHIHTHTHMHIHTHTNTHTHTHTNMPPVRRSVEKVVTMMEDVGVFGLDVPLLD